MARRARSVASSICDGWLTVDPTDASQPDADESGHLGLRVSGVGELESRAA
jgi:hypothetical protein